MQAISIRKGQHAHIKNDDITSPCGKGAWSSEAWGVWKGRADTNYFKKSGWDEESEYKSNSRGEKKCVGKAGEGRG